MPQNPHVAVITGDIIASTNLSPTLLSRVLGMLKQEIGSLNQRPGVQFELYRGDSFQGMVREPEDALAIALQLKFALNRVHDDELTGLLDARIAIGIGSVNLLRESIRESNGEAFQRSGRTLDQMQGQRLALATADPDIDDEFRVHFGFLDDLTSRWRYTAAEVCYGMLMNRLEREIASELGIAQSAVNQRKKAANWESIERLLARFERVIKKRTHDE